MRDKMENIYSVCILRKKEQVLETTFLEEFLKLSGIYVQECVINEKYMLKEPKNIGVDICIKTENVEYSKYPYRIYNIDNEKLGNKALKSLKEKIKDVLDQIAENEQWDTVEDLQILLKIYFDTNYLYYNYWTHLYLYQMSKEEKETILEKYIECINKMSKELGKGNKSVFFEYAYWNCARKINRICVALSIQEVFDNKKLMERVYLLAQKDEKFTMAKVLIGLIGLSTKLYWTDGETILKQAIECEKGKKYSDFLHYTLGHFYELHSENDIEKAWEEYEEVIKINPENYRGQFKIACRKFSENNKADAYLVFLNIYSKMREKKDGGWILPLELEYYSKCVQILNNEYLWDKMIERVEIPSDDCKSFSKKYIFEQVLKRNDNKKYREYFCEKMKGYRQNDILGR